LKVDIWRRLTVEERLESRRAVPDIVVRDTLQARSISRHDVGVANAGVCCARLGGR
jgi:hypothetical protein